MQSQLNNSLLLTQILHQRKAAAIYISSFLKSKVDKIKVIKKSLIIHLIQMRKKSCVKIQSTFRMFLVFSHFKKIFSESKFIFFYDFNANLFHQFKNNNPYMQNQLKIKIFISKGEQYFRTFSYSKYLLNSSCNSTLLFVAVSHLTPSKLHNSLYLYVSPTLIFSTFIILTSLSNTMIPPIHHFVNTKVIPPKHFLDTTMYLCYYSLNGGDFNGNW